MKIQFLLFLSSALASSVLSDTSTNAYLRGRVLQKTQWTPDMGVPYDPDLHYVGGLDGVDPGTAAIGRNRRSPALPRFRTGVHRPVAVPHSGLGRPPVPCLFRVPW